MSSSHDKSLRLWERTREPIILEEEREMVREEGAGGEAEGGGVSLMDCHSHSPEFTCFHIARSEKQSSRRAWPAEMFLW